MTQHYLLRTLLIFGALFGMQPLIAQDRNPAKNPQSTYYPWNDALKGNVKEEMKGMRNRNTKHYLMQDGSMRMISSLDALHYQGANGWEEINLMVNPNTSGWHTTHPYYNGDNSFKTYYPSQLLNDKVYTRLKEGEMSEAFLSMYAADQNGSPVYTLTPNLNAAAVAEKNAVSYNLYPHITVKYEQQSEGRKLNVQLNDAQALSLFPANAKYVVIKEKIVLPVSWTISQHGSSYDIYEGSTWLANLPQAQAFDKMSSSINPDEVNSYMHDGQVMISQQGNELLVYTRFELSWLKQSGRHYPVSLDPTLNFYPCASCSTVAGTPDSFKTGRITNNTTSPNKITGFIRMADAVGTAGGTVSWARFDISTLPAGVTATSSTFYSAHYSGTGASKVTALVGMQTVDPKYALNTTVYTQIATGGPVYNTGYNFGDVFTSPYTWRAVIIGGTGLTDIVNQQAQGWTAMGIKYVSGNTGTMLHYGYEAAFNATTNETPKPYLVVNYSTTLCNGAPTAGNATSTLTLACGDPFILDLNGNTSGVGISYQWQSSPAGANTWTNLGSSQSSSSYSVSQTAATNYRCIVNCSSSGLSSTSALISVGQNAVNSCYCIPTGGATSTNYISSFTTSGASVNVSNPSNAYTTTPVAGYGDFTSMAISAVPGASVTYSISFVTGSNNIGVWVDWNHDGDFNDPGETIISTSTAVTSPYTGSFTVPASPLYYGSTRVRIRNSSTGSASACGASAYGEAEDYTLNILGPCSSAPVCVASPANSVICPLATQALSATVPVLQTGLTYQWKVSTTSGGPYSNVTGGTGATSLSYITASLAAGTYYYVLQSSCANCGGCTALSNEVVVTAQNVPAPTGTNSAQCSPGVPTASVVSNAGAGGTGKFYWYTAATGGTLLQSNPYGPLQPYYFNDFTTSTLTNSSINNAASVTGGALQLFPNATSQYGAFMVNASGINSDKYKVEFDFTTVGTLATMGEGFSYSFGDGVITQEASMPARNGTGSKVKLCFIGANSGPATQGIYFIYGNNVTNILTPATSGVFGYVNNTSWKNTANNHVILTLDSLGRATLVLNGTTIFNNIQYVSASTWTSTNKAAWTHIWKGNTNTGTTTMQVLLDNINVQASTLWTGSPTYLSSISSTTTFYVTELGTNGCFSPRTPVTAVVNTPPTITITTNPGDSVCTGLPVTLHASGAVNYLWMGNPTTVNGDTTFTPAVQGTYTVSGTDANGCTNTASRFIYLHPVVSGTATATPNTICIGNSTSLSATATPICTGLMINGFRDYYFPSSWTFTNSQTNGTLDATGAPANIKMNTGTSGSFAGGYTSIARRITCAGNVTFNWSFNAPLDAYADYPQYSINNGSLIDFPGYNQGPGYGFGVLQTGSMSIPVNAGDTLKIYVWTFDNDPSSGQLIITNFVAPSPRIDGIISYWDAPTGGTNLGTPPITVTPAAAGIKTYYAQYTASTTGCVNLVRQPVNVTVNPLATATVSGGGTVCAGTPLPNVSIALTGASPWNLTYTKNGSNPQTVTGIISSPYIISNAAVGTYAVTNVTGAGCAGSSSGSATVIVNALPTATVSGGGTVCAGVSLPNVSFALTGAGPWNLTYTIDGANPQTITGITSSPYVISNAAAGTYAVSNISDMNCTGTFSGTASVVVIPLPTATVSGGGTVCAGTTLPNVSIDLTGVSPWNLTYNLNGANPQTITGITSSPYVISNAAAGTYAVTTISGAGCSGTPSGSATVVVNALPTATVSGGGQVCAGTPLPNVNIALTGAGPWNITYTIDGSNPQTITGITNSPYVISNAAAGTYAVSSVNDANCTGTFSGSASVVVNPLPTATVSGGGTICAGLPLPNVSIALTGTGPWNLTYTRDGANAITVTNISSSPYVISNAIAGVYAVSNVNDMNCTGTASGSATVVVNPLPTATVTGGGPVCSGSPLPDVSITLTGSGPWSLSYTDGSNTFPVSPLTSPYVISGAAIGTYAVVSVSDINCSGTGSGSVNVVVNPLPNVTAAVTPSTVCYATSASVNGGGATSYTWSNGVLNNTPFVATATTTYTVTGTDANNCSATSTVTLTVNGISSNLTLATGGNSQSNAGVQNGSYYQPDGSTLVYGDNSCNLIATVNDGSGGNVLGNTVATVTVEPTVLLYPAVGGQPYSRRWFTITPTNNGPATVTLYQTQDDFDTYNTYAAANGWPLLPTGGVDNGNVRISKVDGTLGTGTALVINPTVNWNAGTNYWEITFSVPGFSQFYIHAVNPLNAALPVTLTSFSGEKENGQDILNWISTSEQQCASYQLNYSTDGIHTSVLARIPSKAVKGNSATPLAYQFIHTNPAQGHNYYSLTALDIDGQESRLPETVDLIWTNTGNWMQLYPNPAQEVLHMDLHADKDASVQIKIQDISGRTVKWIQSHVHTGANSIDLDLEHLSDGLYTVVIEMDQLPVGNSRFIIRH